MKSKSKNKKEFKMGTGIWVSCKKSPSLDIITQDPFLLLKREESSHVYLACFEIDSAKGKSFLNKLRIVRWDTGDRAYFNSYSEYLIVP